MVYDLTNVCGGASTPPPLNPPLDRPDFREGGLEVTFPANCEGSRPWLSRKMSVVYIDCCTVHPVRV